jgi:hypothetical protein
VAQWRPPHQAGDPAGSGEDIDGAEVVEHRSGRVTHGSGPLQATDTPNEHLMKVMKFKRRRMKKPIPDDFHGSRATDKAVAT